MILCGLMEIMEIENKVETMESVFQEMAVKEDGFKELQWKELGDYGLNVAKVLQDSGRTEVSKLTKTF
jgi:hypothetical protein